jgi:hypothetical protein
MPEEIDWKAALPDELKTHPTLKDYKGDLVQVPLAVVKSLIDTKALVGSSLRIPGADAGPEALKEFAGKIAEKVPQVVYLPDDPGAREVALKDIRKKIGVPDDPKAYSVDGLDLGDVKFDEAQLDAMRKDAGELGLTKDAFRVAVKKAADVRLLVTKAEKDARSALQRELGAAFEDRTLSAALSAEKRGFPDETVRALRNGTVDLKTFKAFDAVARGFGESRQVADQGGGSGNGKPTPAEALVQRAEIMARPEYFRPTPAQMAVHQSLVTKVQELNDYIAQAG